MLRRVPARQGKTGATFVGTATSMRDAGARASDMADATAIIRARDFSAEDLLAVFAFSEPPAGQKMFDKLPAVTRQTLSVGARFAQPVG
jgi:hypothetical protein